jgi:hypothetical protein
MFLSSGIKASELVAHLQQLIKEHGDLQVYAGGGDYPEGVTGVAFVTPKRGDSYVPGNTFKVF